MIIKFNYYACILNDNDFLIYDYNDKIHYHIFM